MIKLLLKHKQLIKYLIAGGAAAAVDLSLLYFFTDILGVWYLISASLAFVAAFFVSFFLQKFWTFRDNGKERMYRQMGAYLAIAVINLCLNAILMYLLVDGLKVWYMFAQFFASGLIACESYFVYKILIFHKRPGQTAGRPKVLIATGIYPPDIGGPATMLKALADALSLAGFAMQTITYADRTEPGAVYRIARPKNKYFGYLNYFWHLLVLSRLADVLYVTDTYSVGYFAYLIKKLTNKKYIIRFAGDSAWETAAGAGWTDDYIADFQNKKYNGKIEKLKARQRKILINADAVIAVSDFMAGLAKIIGVKEEVVTVIYNAVDFFPAPLPRRASPRPTLVYSGRLVAWKGVAMLIRLVKELLKIRPDILLEILGDGPDEAGLKALAKELELDKNIKFFGRVSEEASHEIFSGSTVFVLNTNYEGLPHSILNAMRAGLPVITTPAGGNTEVVRDGVNGLLVPYDDLDGWIKAVNKLLNDENLRQKFSETGLITAAQFKWSQTIEKTAALIRGLAKP